MDVTPVARPDHTYLMTESMDRQESVTATNLLELLRKEKLSIPCFCGNGGENVCHWHCPECHLVLTSSEKLKEHLSNHGVYKCHLLCWSTAFHLMILPGFNLTLFSYIKGGQSFNICLLMSSATIQMHRTLLRHTLCFLFFPLFLKANLHMSLNVRRAKKGMI